MDESDIREEDLAILVFVFGDVLLNSKNTHRGTAPVSFLAFQMDVCFKGDATSGSHLADVFQIHWAYNDFVVIWHKLLVDGMVKRP